MEIWHLASGIWPTLVLVTIVIEAGECPSSEGMNSENTASSEGSGPTSDPGGDSPGNADPPVRPSLAGDALRRRESSLAPPSDVVHTDTGISVESDFVHTGISVESVVARASASLGDDWREAPEGWIDDLLIALFKGVLMAVFAYSIGGFMPYSKDQHDSNPYQDPSFVATVAVVLAIIYLVQIRYDRRRRPLYYHLLWRQL